MSLRKKNDGFVALKSKIYSIKDEIQKENRENKKRKGFSSIAVNNIKHKEYLDVSFNKKSSEACGIQSKLHKIETYGVSKISLSCFDDKRYILDDGINSWTYFHKDTRDH